MSRYRKSDDIKDHVDLESPHKNKSFEERTGEKFRREVRCEIIPEGNGYVKLRPRDEGE